MNSGTRGFSHRKCRQEASVIDGIRRLVRLVFFQGNLRAKRYFDGWYFKHVSADRSSIFALIPGISLSPRGSHSFGQLIYGSTGRTQ
jgi:tocopherol cyclase